jgi:hypothetical protein
VVLLLISSEVSNVPAFEELVIRQGGMFFGFIILVVVSFIIFNAIVKD